MEAHSGRGRGTREILGLVALFLLSVTGLVLIMYWRGDNSSSDDAHSPWRIDNESFRSARIAISPSGVYLAGICPAPKAAAATPQANNAMQLVVWRVASGEELARIDVDEEGAGDIRWSSNEQFIGLEGRFGQILHWKSEQLATAPISRVITGGLGDTDLDIMSSHLDMNGDVKVQFMSNGQVQAFRLSTGTAIPLKWRTPYDRSDVTEHSLILRPSRPGGPLHALLARMEEIPRPTPTPTPTPAATPAATPAPSAEQKAYLEKARVLDQELEQIVEKLQGETPPSDEEAARLEARGNAIVAERQAERERLFSAAPRPPRQETTPRPLRFARLQLVDLKSGQTIWERRIATIQQFRHYQYLPDFSWSPDGAVLAMLGMPRPDTEQAGGKSSGGVDFLAATNGSTIGSATLNEEHSPHPTGYGPIWLPDRVMVIDDFKTFDPSPELVFLQAHGGKVLERRVLPDFANAKDINSISVADASQMWALASGKHGWRVYTDADFAEGKPPYASFP